MPTEPDDVTVAALFRAVLRMGIATPADLQPWADREVMSRPSPPEWVLDVCTSGNSSPARVVELLLEPASGFDAVAVFRLLVGLIEPDESWKYEQATRADEYMLAAAPNRYASPLADEIACHDDGLMGKHYVGRDDVPAFVAGVVAFVRKHADRSARALLPGVRLRFE